MEQVQTKKQTKKAPIIKQTKTSVYRMAKANPLMFLNGKDNVIKTQKIDIPKSVVIPNTDFKNRTTLDRTASVRVPSQKTNAHNLHRSNSVRPTSVKFSNKIPSEVRMKKENPKHVSKMNQKEDKPARRSLSADHYLRKKQMQKETSASANDVSSKLTSVRLSPIQRRGVTFKTPIPINHARRTLHPHTPTPFQKRSSTPFATPPLYTTKDLWRRLKIWLKERNRPMHSFHHLRCFSLNEDVEENKENVERTVDINSSYEMLNVCNDEKTLVNESGVDVEKLTQDALEDLHSLILEGFSTDQCEAWLSVMRDRHRNLDKTPLYWECRAAIEQSRGNITSAVGYYQNAIMRGAQVNKVDESLERLLEKFSLLNISATEPTIDTRMKKERARVVTDARNIFKSSIIKFAVAARNTKIKSKDEKTFIATPVRRSTRTTSSIYNSTPGIQLCTSLRELNATSFVDIDFKNNEALI